MSALVPLAAFWLVLIVVAAIIAREKGNSQADAVILTLFLGPVGLIATILAKSKAP